MTHSMQFARFPGNTVVFVEGLEAGGPVRRSGTLRLCPPAMMQLLAVWPVARLVPHSHDQFVRCQHRLRGLPTTCLGRVEMQSHADHDPAHGRHQR